MNTMSWWSRKKSEETWELIKWSKKERNQESLIFLGRIKNWLKEQERAHLPLLTKKRRRSKRNWRFVQKDRSRLKKCQKNQAAHHLQETKKKRRKKWNTRVSPTQKEMSGRKKGRRSRRERREVRRKMKVRVSQNTRYIWMSRLSMRVRRKRVRMKGTKRSGRRKHHRRRKEWWKSEKSRNPLKNQLIRSYWKDWEEWWIARERRRSFLKIQSGIRVNTSWMRMQTHQLRRASELPKSHRGL